MIKKIKGEKMKQLYVAFIAVAIAGCSAQSQLLINPSRHTMRCSAHGIGLDGVIVTNSNMSNCVSDYAKLGYIPVDEAGVTGINFADGKGKPIISKLAKGSPAEKAGIVVGDTVLSVNDEKPTTSGDAIKALFGRAGETITVTVSGASGTRTLQLVLAPYTSLYGAQPAK